MLVTDNSKNICLVEDDNIETFKVQQQEFFLSPLHKQYQVLEVVGACHGLVCLFGLRKGFNKNMLVIWNPAIGKSFGIVAPDHSYSYSYAFGVCPVTRDPTVVNLIQTHNKPWHVEVFTFSSSSDLPCESAGLNSKTRVVIDRFIYWGAREEAINNYGKYTTNPLVVSFDLITKEFKVVDLPDSLTNELTYRYVSVSKLRESLVVYGSIKVNGAQCCGVWVMEHDSSFRKLLTTGERASKLLVFSNNGEPILEMRRKDGVWLTPLGVYNPCSQEIKYLGISGVAGTFFIGSYKESLLLLDHSDSNLHYDHN